MMVQHQGTPESITEMAPRYHHFHVFFVDCVLDRISRPHLCTRRLVEQQCQGMLWRGQRFRLHCPYDGGTSAAAAADVRRHSSRQREYSTSQYRPRTLTSSPVKLTRLPDF
jgi:hypothetical protein